MVKPAITLNQAHWDAMLNDVVSRLPEEACGIIAGVDGVSLAVFPINNALHSSNTYRMQPEEQLKAMLTIENQEWDLLAIYHSHPQGPSYPSSSDIALASYPEATHLIWSLHLGNWTCQGYSIRNGQVSPVNINIY
jgi:proteasome lid subunit RPN8/RPN11